MAEQLSADALYLMHLVSCALRDAAPQALPAGATWDGVYLLALNNSVATTCAFAVTKAPGIEPAEGKRWRDEVYKNAVRHAVFADEREAIFAAMDEAGLAHLSLKGVVTAAAYPHPEMRWMCDNDFLFGRDQGDGDVRPADDADSRALRRIMETRGYEVEEFERSNHDAYQKPPFLNFEPHRALADDTLSWRGYFDKAWLRAHRAQDAAGLAYEFSREDAYIFHLAHLSKHYSGRGSGVRGIADQWALQQAWGGDMDRAYLDAELAKLADLGLVDVEPEIRRLAAAVIDRDACGQVLAGNTDALASEDAAILAYMLGSGTYGTFENYTRNRVRVDAAREGLVGARVHYLLRRLFPPTKTLADYYPVLKRAPWLRPAVDLYRFTVRPFQKRKRVGAELAAVMGKGGKESPTAREE